MSAESIKQRIRAEALRRRPAPIGEPMVPEGQTSGLQPLPVDTKTSDARDEQVHLNDLLSYSDEDFVRNAYRTLLKREADSDGLNNYLAWLRTGRVDKIEILGGISRSQEGRKRKIKVKGLWLRYRIRQLYRIPAAGYLFRIVTAVLNLPRIIRNMTVHQMFTDRRIAGKADDEALRELQTDAARKAEALEALREDVTRKAEALEALRTDAARKAEILETVRADKADLNMVEDLQVKVREMFGRIQDHRLSILDQERRLLSLLEEVRRRLPEALSHEQIQNVLKEEDRVLDAMYLMFEDRFRGTRSEIKGKLRIYLPYVNSAKTGNEDIAVLDVGCGRGEWLELLREAGCRARGVDINRVALQQCRERGLDAAEADVNDYLRGLNRGSLDVVTGFHIIEHLSFAKLIALFDEALAVLRPGGMIIFETPNPANILVSAYDFYRDPSHVKPLHPDTVNFIAESRGFLRTGAYFVLGEGSEAKLIPSKEWALNDINDYIRAPRDFALIGYKP